MQVQSTMTHTHRKKGPLNRKIALGCPFLPLKIGDMRVDFLMNPRSTHSKSGKCASKAHFSRQPSANGVCARFEFPFCGNSKNISPIRRDARPSTNLSLVLLIMQSCDIRRFIRRNRRGSFAIRVRNGRKSSISGYWGILEGGNIPPSKVLTLSTRRHLPHEERCRINGFVKKCLFPEHVHDAHGAGTAVTGDNAAAVGEINFPEIAGPFHRFQSGLHDALFTP